MQDHAARLVGPDGVVVTDVRLDGEQLDLQVELLARATGCPHCRSTELRVKERSLVRVRDLPIGGRPTRLLWRKRRYRCGGCGRTFTETHEQLPARQRVTGRFRAWLADRVADGPRTPRSRARSAPAATRSPVPSPSALSSARRVTVTAGRGGRRSMRHITAAAASWRRSARA